MPCYNVCRLVAQIATNLHQLAPTLASCALVFKFFFFVSGDQDELEGLFNHVLDQLLRRSIHLIWRFARV